MKTKTLNPELLRSMDAYWRAANYLSVGQIYLYDYPLLKRPLTLADVVLTFTAYANLGGGADHLVVDINGVAVGNVFGPDGSDWPERSRNGASFVPKVWNWVTSRPPAPGRCRRRCRRYFRSRPRGGRVPA